MMHAPIVLDSSAVLAHLNNEPGATITERALAGESVISAACWSEIKQKIEHRGFPWSQAVGALRAYNIHIEPVTALDADVAASLWRPGGGLSLADRLCLALGQRLNAEILTADSAWAGMPGVTVIR